MARQRRSYTRQQSIEEQERLIRAQAEAQADARIRVAEAEEKLKREWEKSGPLRFIPPPPDQKAIYPGWQSRERHAREYKERTGEEAPPRWSFPMPGGRWTREREPEAIQAMRAKAEFDAVNFEKQYTQKQKLEIAHWKRVGQAIDMNSDFSEGEKESVRRLAAMRVMGIQPSELPKTTPWEKGKGVGDMWKGLDGSIIGRKPDGSTQLIQRWDQGPDAQSMKEEQDSLKAQAKLQVELDKEKRTFIRDLHTKEIAVGTDVSGRPIKRVRNNEEIQAILQRIYPDPQQQQQQQQQRDVKRAQDVVDRFRKQYKNIDEIPENMRQQFFDAVDLLQGASPQEAEGQQDQQEGQISSEEEYRALPPGAVFIDPEGKRRRKPGR